jgi:hypothetical protein
MYRHSVSPRIVWRLAPHSLFAALATVVFVAAACTDSTPSVTAPASRLSASVSANGLQQSAASGFSVLANAAVTCTNGTVTGSIGTFLAAPTGSVTQTSCPVSGSVDVGDGSSTQAFNAFLTTYAALAPQAGDVCTTLSGTLAGVTLAPGAYCFDAAATLTGLLTLQGPANGVWTFKVGTSGTGALTGTNFSMVMAGGAQGCNVTWWVAQAATMTTSSFIGNILAGAGITLTGGTFSGKIWSQADVTITGTALVGCGGTTNGIGGNNGHGSKCNQGVGNGPEGCDPGNSNNHNGSNDENGGTPGNPGRKP